MAVFRTISPRMTSVRPNCRSGQGQVNGHLHSMLAGTLPRYATVRSRGLNSGKKYVSAQYSAILAAAAAPYAQLWLTKKAAEKLLEMRGRFVRLATVCCRTVKVERARVPDAGDDKLRQVEERHGAGIRAKLPVAVNVRDNTKGETI